MQHHFTGLHEITRLDSVEIDAAGLVAGIPFDRMHSGIKVTVGDSRHFLSEDVVNRDHNIGRDR